MGSILRCNHSSSNRCARLSHHHPVRNQIPSQRPMENRVRLGTRAIQRIRHANWNHRARGQSPRLYHRRGRRRGGSDHLHRIGAGAAAAGGGGGGGGAACATSLCRRSFTGGGGATFAARAGATTRLLTTVLTPSIDALSADASARDASLSTLPFSVATPLATLT